jgi:serine/threonine protein kinase
MMNQAQQTHFTLEQLTAFGHGELNDAEHAEIENHVTECDTCCQILRNLPDDTIVAMLREQAETSVSPDQGSATAKISVTLSPEHSTLRADLPIELSKHSRYEVSELLGKGGMGDVYKAHHRMMNRPVALKLINQQLMQSDAAVKRFHREVQAAARLSHPNIVTAFDAEQAGDSHFLVMEFVNGMDLGEVIRQRGPLPVQEACEFIRQAANGLQYAHELGMVHRDIKPQNLMLTDDGKVKILDFGLASLTTETVVEPDATTHLEPVANMATAQLTKMGSTMGTPDYISPEQTRDAHSVDIRSDIYSLGCTLYCLLTRQPPFSGDSVIDKLMAHAEQDPKPLASFREDIPTGLEDVLNRMMAKQPGDRFQTPAEVAQALSPYATSAAVLVKQTAVARSRTIPKMLVACLLLGLFVVLGTVIVIATNRGRMVIQSEVDDLKIAVIKGGEQVEIIDLQSGSKVSWLPTGKYELQLIGDANAVTIENNRFEMTRLGQVIVTAKWNSEGNSTVASFTPPAETIARDAIEIDGESWKFTATENRSLALFEVAPPNFSPGPIFYRAKLKTENVQGRVYLEMWARFPGKGEFFSKGIANAISGTNDWSEYEVPFLLKAGRQPDLIKLNLTIEGTGTLWIKDVELRGRLDALSTDQTGRTDK